MNVIAKAAELRQNTNTAARALAAPFRKHGPSPADLLELGFAAAGLVAMLFLRAILARVMDAAVDRVQDLFAPRRPAPVLRLVVRE